MFGFAPLTSVPLSSLPATGAQAATGFVSGSFGTPLAGYARTQPATGAAPSTTFGAATFGTTVTATGEANTCWTPAATPWRLAWQATGSVAGCARW